MKNTFTCLVILTLLLTADALCIKQTIDLRELNSGLTTALLLTAEGVFGGVMIASGLSLLRKRFARQKKPVSRRPVAATVRA